VLQVRSDRGGSAPATWGQVDIWRCIAFQRDDPAYFNFTRILPLPTGTTESAVINALSGLVEGNDALRTWFRPDDSMLIQTVRTTVRLRVARHTVPAGAAPEAASALAEQFKARPFRAEDPDEPPLRCALVAEAETGPARLVFAFDHQAIDGSSAQILLAQVESLLAGKELAPTSQPLDMAAYERGPEGRRASDLALRHWRRNLPRGPRTLFDHPARQPLTPRFRRYTLESQAAAVATTKAAARSKVSTSTVLLTAVAATLGARSGRQLFSLLLISANRLDTRRAALVAPQAQNALCLFDCTGASFDEAARRSAVSALAAYAASAYDPDELEAVYQAVAAECAAPFDPSVFFNDVRRREHWEDLPRVEDEAALRDLATSTTVSETGAWDLVGAKFFVDVQYARDRCVLNAQVDTECVGPQEAEQWLRGVERLLMRAAFSDVSLATLPDLTAATGVPVVERGEEWVRSGPDWVLRHP
jgi:hypothetical protein